MTEVSEPTPDPAVPNTDPPEEGEKYDGGEIPEVPAPAESEDTEEE